MRNECNIIRDILPLYAEEMVSTDTAAFVEEHLDTCAACRGELETLKTPRAFERPDTTPAPEVDDGPLKAIQQRWKKQKKLMIRNTVIATVTVMVVALAITLATVFLVRGARKTVSLYDYALTLGSDDLFAAGSSHLYRKVSEAQDGRIYIEFDSIIEDFAFPATFGKEPLAQLSPYEYAATYGGVPLYIRGDGSLWALDHGNSDLHGLICVRPYFAEPEAHAPAAERSIELLELNFDHETHIICDDSNTMYAVYSPAHSLIFRFAADEPQEPYDAFAVQPLPYAALSVQLEDGSWYRLETSWDISATLDQDGQRHGWICLPFLAATAHIPEGQYCLAVYDSVNGEEVTLAVQEFTLSWEGSYCRITGSEG